MAEFVVEFGKVGRPPEADGRLDAPAYHRNHAAIWAAIAPFLEGRTGDALELGSGTGQHVVTFAQATPSIIWWPSDPNDKHLHSIEAWRRHAQLANVRPPMRIDISASDWRAGQREDLPQAFLAIVCINVLHIAPWRVAEGLLRCAARALQPDGRLFVYGPFMRDGEHTAPSNAAFDASLRQENAEWGVRDIADLAALAAGVGMKLAATVDMPSNNMVLVFERGG